MRLYLGLLQGVTRVIVPRGLPRGEVKEVGWTVKTGPGGGTCIHRAAVR